MKKYIINIYFPLCLLIIWYISSHYNIVNSFLLPSPKRIADTFFTLFFNGTLLTHTLASLTRIFIGFSIAMTMAFVCSITFYLIPSSFKFFSSTIKFIQHLPPLALLSLLILWFGIGEKSKIVMIILASFFPIFINTFNGISNCDPKLIDLGRVVGMPKKDIFFSILLPASIPYIFIGMKLGLTYAWRALMGAELIATSSGLGYMILDARELSRSDIVFVGILCFGFMGIFIDKCFDFLLSKFPYIKERQFNEPY